MRYLQEAREVRALTEMARLPVEQLALTRIGHIEQVEALGQHPDTIAHQEAVKPTGELHRVVEHTEVEHLPLHEDIVALGVVAQERLPTEAQVAEPEVTVVVLEPNQEVEALRRAEAPTDQVARAEVEEAIVHLVVHQEAQVALEVQEVHLGHLIPEVGLLEEVGHQVDDLQEEAEVVNRSPKYH